MLGIDLVEIKRFAKIKKSDYRFWQKVFTKNEWHYCFSAATPKQHLAGIFAAKEALMKALGKKFLGRFDLIEISHDAQGKPLAKIKKLKKRMEITISDEKEYAIAAALIFGNRLKK